MKSAALSDKILFKIGDNVRFLDYYASDNNPIRGEVIDLKIKTKHGVRKLFYKVKVLTMQTNFERSGYREYWFHESELELFDYLCKHQNMIYRIYNKIKNIFTNPDK